MDIRGNDWLYIAGGAAALYLILKNQKQISSVVAGASSTVSPLLAAAGKGAAIVTDPESWEYHTPFEAPYTPAQAVRALQANITNPLYWLNVPWSVINSAGKNWGPQLVTK